MRKNLQTQFSARQYMLSRDFEIYYYNDSVPNQVQAHSHDYYEFYFFLEGNVSMEIDAAEYPLQYGDVLLIPPGIRHHAIIRDTKAAYRRFVFWISREYCARLLEESVSYGYLMQHVQTAKEYIFHNDRITFNLIQTKIFHLIEECRGNRFGKEAKIPLCVDDLILHINRVFYEQRSRTARLEVHSLYESLVDYIESHLDEELSLDALAGQFFVSKYYISHLFKDNTGISIHQYIAKKRVTACREAILGGMKISDACLMYGYQDYSGFYRAFKKEFGISPRECIELEKPGLK